MGDLCTSKNQASKCAKEKKKVPSRPGYRVFIDISSFKHESRGGNRHWLIAVDEFSDCSHSFCSEKKSDQIAMIPKWIKVLSSKYGIEVKRIRLDNSGENRSIQKECDKQNLGVNFEFMAHPSRIQLLKGKSQQSQSYVDTSMSESTKKRIFM